MAVSPEFQKLLPALPMGFADPEDSVAEVREKMAQVHGHPFGDDMIVEGMDLLGVPAAKIGTPEAMARDAVVLQFHGGAFISCDLSDYLFYGARISRNTGLAVLEIGYRLAPEYPCPAGVTDCAQAYRGLLDHGVDPGRIALIGDSCGGGMVLAALALLRDAGDPMPACAATLSGWFDLEARGTAAQGPDEPFLTTDWLRARGRDYVGAAGDLRSPLASPIEADLTGFPPLLLQAGGADLVRDDSRQLAEKATRAGVDTTLQIVPEMIHGWHGLPVPEADEALAAVGAFFASHLD
ncbi:MAG: alpha/beta hydrolase [Candidatus Binatia bacterium]|nr:alpha/beta hydrolase [Candidatus Binatia bacterium]MDG1957841.1 alpha/beta hydrolase [Candidatus Binatia bacterium]MDG2008818.1 alpha/beta hydrolase [Candidatus Binatia bacterium]